MERLQKFLSECGVASRRKSEELILKGKVSIILYMYELN